MIAMPRHESQISFPKFALAFVKQSPIANPLQSEAYLERWMRPGGVAYFRSTPRLRIAVRKCRT